MFPRKTNLDRVPADNFDVYMQPALEPLRLLADQTGGDTVAVAEELPRIFDQLAGRWRLYYRTARPLDGRLRPVLVYHPDANKTRLKAPSWARSSTPEALAGARARGLVEGVIGRGDLPLKATLTGAGGERAVDLVVEWKFLGDPPPRPFPVRVTVGYSRPGKTPEVEHTMITIPVPSDVPPTWSHRQPIDPPSDSEWLAVTVEDLFSRQWGGLSLKM